MQLSSLLFCPMTTCVSSDKNSFLTLFKWMSECHSLGNINSALFVHFNIIVSIFLISRLYTSWCNLRRIFTKHRCCTAHLYCLFVNYLRQNQFGKMYIQRVFFILFWVALAAGFESRFKNSPTMLGNVFPHIYLFWKYLVSELIKYWWI